jgi:hypothetical protein
MASAVISKSARQRVDLTRFRAEQLIAAGRTVRQDQPMRDISRNHAVHVTFALIIGLRGFRSVS